MSWFYMLYKFLCFLFEIHNWVNRSVPLLRPRVSTQGHMTLDEILQGFVFISLFVPRGKVTLWDFEMIILGKLKIWND